jgi:arginase
VDQGALPRVSFAPDPLSPQAQNLPLVAAVARQVAQRVSAALRQGMRPLVIGGDCTVTLGVVAGILEHAASPGLVYVDGDLDMNVPEDSPSGIFDGMVLAHLLGQGAGELCRIGPRFPLLQDDDVVLFGYNASSGHVDPWEQRKLAASSMRRYSAACVRQSPAETAEMALAGLGDPSSRVLVHFDVDVLDSTEFPAVDLPHTGGLTRTELQAALRVFVQSPRFAGLVVTEFNAARDPDLALARRLVDLLADAFRGPS